MTFYFAASQLKLLQMHRRTAGVLYKQQMYPLGIIQIRFVECSLLARKA